MSQKSAVCKIDGQFRLKEYEPEQQPLIMKLKRDLPLRTESRNSSSG